jgi:hypothetical protein
VRQQNSEPLFTSTRRSAEQRGLKRFVLVAVAAQVDDEKAEQQKDDHTDTHAEGVQGVIEIGREQAR